jgi:hypothetical protein
MQDPNNNEPTHARLFITHRAPGLAPGAVGEIFKRTRERHDRLGVAGVLLFDGASLGHALSGTLEAVTQAFEAALADPRQTGLVLLSAVEGELPAGWPVRGWRSGWTEPDVLARLAAEDGPRGDAALAWWLELMGASDLL